MSIDNKRKIWILTTVISVLLLLFLPFTSACMESDEPIRIHIRANSDENYDQAVKYVVRDEITEYLSELLVGIKSRDQAKTVINLALTKIEKTASSTLERCGFGYGAKARFSREYFPDRYYGNVFYPAGEYDALIVELGKGVGGNWWCVAYPPLCFYGDDGEEFRYKSLIAELLGLS
ncbi:MAG: stage II sporulation protein R [Clostridia bacterium]|nr:stage II sporulation protein R [Clostridia bacterium]